jgi:two-component system chemotaxis response regulator CheB
VPAVPLWEVEGAFQSYRCYNGHVATLQGLAAHQSDEVEQSLWAAVRAMQERSFTLDRMADDMRARAAAAIADEYARRADESREHADRIRALVLGLQLAES